jgi:hypothetical protein
VVFTVFASLAALSSGGSQLPRPEAYLPLISTLCQQCWAPLIRSLEVSLTPTLTQSARGSWVSKSKGDVAWLAADPLFPEAGSQPWSSQGIEEPHPACGQGLLRISV